MFSKIRTLIVLIRDIYLTRVKWKRYTFGKNFHAGRNVVIWGKHTISIGDNCYIGRNSQIECNVKIGHDVLIANNVAFIGRYDHNYQQIGQSIRFASQVRDDDYSWKELDQITTVGNDIWIGYGSIILSGVNIADGTIIAAGSVVTKNTDPYSIYAGVPASKISSRFNSIDDLESHFSSLTKNQCKAVSK